MFCKKCGSEMSETARFCIKCGNERTSEQAPIRKIVEDDHIKYQLKPEFHVLYKLISNTGKVLLCMFLICFLLTDFYEVFFIRPSLLLLTIVIVVICIVGKMMLEKLQYDYLEYNFYTTKVEYKDGLFYKEEKELKYKAIREIYMSQNIIERFFCIGTIRIYTNASTGDYGRQNHGRMKGKNGIYIHCVKDVQNEYQKIKRIIDEGTTE